MMNFDKVSALGESNSIIKDLSQYGNNGTAYNEATWTGNGKRGGAFGFSGTTTRNTIQINDAPSLDGMSGLTISTRVKFNSN